MNKKIISIIGIILILSLGLGVYILVNKSSPSSAIQTKTQKKLAKQEKAFHTLPSSTEISESSSWEMSESSVVNEIDVREELEDFGKKWINYNSIYQRNQSVKSYLSQKAIQDNSIDVNPNVEIKATGKITDISQSIINKDQYVLVGEETVGNSWNKIVLVVILDPSTQEITMITVNYMRQAY